MAEQTPLRLDQNRLAYIDGMRGMAAMIVVFYHYLLCFYPAPFSGVSYSGIKQIILESPISLFFNSSFAVCLFFVISGFALSRKFFVTKDNNYLTSSAIRRYFRLEIPILFSVLLSYLLSVTGIYYACINSLLEIKPDLFQFLNSSFFKMSPNFWTMLKASLYSALFSGGTINYNPVLWTMCIEFFGSIIVFATLALFGKIKNRFVIYGILLVLLHSNCMPAFIIGIALCDFYTSKEREKLSAFPVIVLLLTSLYVSSYRSSSHSTLWSILNPISSIDGSYPYIIGASLFLFVAINSNVLQKLFSLPLFKFLGKISFSIYLVHLLFIGTISCSILNILFTNLRLNYDLSFVIMFFVSVAITIAFSYLMYKYIDQMGIKFSKWVFEKF